MRKGFIFDPVTSKSVWVNVTKGELRQPSYSRGPKTHASSSGLLGFRSCVQTEMAGKKGDRKAIRAAFTSAAKKCA